MSGSNDESGDLGEDEGGFAYHPPSQKYAYSNPPAALPGIDRPFNPEPWGMRDRDRGTPLEQLPEQIPGQSNWVQGLTRIQRSASGSDPNMNVVSPTSADRNSVQDGAILSGPRRYRGA